MEPLQDIFPKCDEKDCPLCYPEQYTVETVEEAPADATEPSPWVGEYDYYTMDTESTVHDGDEDEEDDFRGYNDCGCDLCVPEEEEDCCPDEGDCCGECACDAAAKQIASDLEADIFAIPEKEDTAPAETVETVLVTQLPGTDMPSVFNYTTDEDQAYALGVFFNALEQFFDANEDEFDALPPAVKDIVALARISQEKAHIRDACCALVAFWPFYVTIVE